MPKTVSQWTGLLVTAIVVFGCDADVMYAMPLGIFAGALAAMFVAASEHRANAPQAVSPRRSGSR